MLSDCKHNEIEHENIRRYDRILKYVMRAHVTSEEDIDTLEYILWKRSQLYPTIALDVIQGIIKKVR